MILVGIFVGGFTLGLACSWLLYHIALVGYEVRRSIEGS